MLAYAGAVTACRYAAKSEPGAQVVMLESAFFQALVSEGFGTISGEEDSHHAYSRTSIICVPSIFALVKAGGLLRSCPMAQISSSPDKEEPPLASVHVGVLEMTCPTILPDGLGREKIEGSWR